MGERNQIQQLWDAWDTGRHGGGKMIRSDGNLAQLSQAGVVRTQPEVGVPVLLLSLGWKEETRMLTWQCPES